MKTWAVFSLFFFLTFILSGCAPKTIKIEKEAPLQVQKERIQEKEEKEGEIERKAKEGEKIQEEELMVSSKEKTFEEILKSSPLKDIHFDFDSYTIKKEEIELLNEIGKWLKENKKIRILIEGHCDERGTVEYNLVLGQRRAEAVKTYLKELGIEENRMRTISYGKERPLDPAHTEEAWSKNRRAHFEIER